MRRFQLLAAFSAAAIFTQQGVAQTRVGVRHDSAMLRLTEVRPTADQVHQWSLHIEELVARNRRMDEMWKQLQSDTTAAGRDRVATMQEEMMQRTFEVLSAQTRLAQLCAMLRPAVQGPSGTLGLNVDTPVQFMMTQGPDGKSLTMTFDGSPRISSVDPGSPADKAGVRVGDVWSTVNGKPLSGEVRFDELLTPGSSVTIRVLREGHEKELPPMLVVAKKSDYPDECAAAQHITAVAVPFMERSIGVSPDRPMVAARGGGFSARPSVGAGTVFMSRPTMVLYGGASLQPVDDKWRSLMDVQGEGLVVVDVAPGLSAEQAGLQKFDVIRQVNGETVTSATMFQVIAARERTLVLTVFNKDANSTRTVTMSR